MSGIFAACRCMMPSLARAKVAIEPSVPPEPERDWKRIDVDLVPPGDLVTTAMQLAVMNPTNWDGELVADSVSKCAQLGKREVMRVRRRSTAHKAWLPRHELPVFLIAQANRFTQRTDCAIARCFTGHCPSARIRLAGGHHALDGDSIGWLATG